MQYGLGLGSNLGDTRAHLQAALRWLRTLATHSRVETSSLYESDPVDCPPGSPPFLNAIALLDSPLHPTELLHKLQDFERQRGRPERYDKNSPRPLDLDILFAGGELSQDPSLTLPHPRALQRRFVLAPLAELRPDLILPGQNKSVLELLHALPPEKTGQEVRLARILPQDVLHWMKGRHPRPLALTAYDYPTARLLDEGGVDILHVGDTLGMMMLGHPDTTQVTMEHMLHHTRAVATAKPRALITADLPIHSYNTPAQALENSRALIQAGADAVKLEGGQEIAPQIQAVLAAGIPVQGHLGMLPQQVKEEGGYKKKGRDLLQRQRLLSDATLLDQLGCFSVVLECVVEDVAAEITASVAMTTLGIASGNRCDGEIRVIHDMIGLYPWFRPPFVKPVDDLASRLRSSVKAIRSGIA